MSKYKDADLILKLYDLRREAKMREAREWFFTFNPQSPQDFMDVLTSDKSAYYRMVVSYWDMACTLVNHGAIDADMFAEANGEHMFVYAKIEPFIPALREAMGIPQMLANLEKVVKETPDYEEMIKGMRERMAKFAELIQQKNAAQAAVAGS
jgi:hypothetical protein